MRLIRRAMFFHEDAYGFEGRMSWRGIAIGPVHFEVTDSSAKVIVKIGRNDLTIMLYHHTLPRG